MCVPFDYRRYRRNCQYDNGRLPHLPQRVEGQGRPETQAPDALKQVGDDVIGMGDWYAQRVVLETQGTADVDKHLERAALVYEEAGYPPGG